MMKTKEPINKDSSDKTFLSKKAAPRIKKLYKIFLVIGGIAPALMLWIGNVLVEHKNYIDLQREPEHFDICMRRYYLGQQVLNWTYWGILVMGLCAVPYVVICLRSKKE